MIKNIRENIYPALVIGLGIGLMCALNTLYQLNISL